MRGTCCSILIFGIAGLGLATGAWAQPTQAVTAGELIVEPPTLISLGFEWYIEGDADRDAAVAVAYRRTGEPDWHKSLPLLRVNGERTFYVDTLYYTAPNMFAGSVFDLTENSAYEVRFTLTDPDGVNGQAERVVTVRTRPEPQPSSITRARNRSLRSRGCSPRTTKTRSAAIGAAPRRRACSPATRSSCMPVSTRISIARVTATRSARNTKPAAPRRGTARSI
jgi:hypothetical protein